jgi:hypothetical protein
MPGDALRCVWGLQGLYTRPFSTLTLPSVVLCIAASNVQVVQLAELSFLETWLSAGLVHLLRCTHCIHSSFSDTTVGGSCCLVDPVQYGSAEAAAEAMEASKDRTRKSELQTVRHL